LPKVFSAVGEKLTAQTMPALHFAPGYGFAAFRQSALRGFGIRQFFQV
jgi:hypothetical protein